VALKADHPADRTVPDAAVTEEAPRQPERESKVWFGAARNVRVKILAVVVLLLAGSAVASTFAIRQLLLIRLDDRVQDAGQQEVLELERLLAVGRDPETGEPFDTPRALFDAYLARNVPSSEEALLTFVDGQFYRSALARFPLDQLPAAQLTDWADLSSHTPEETESVTGKYETELGTAYFRVRRVLLGESVGAFVVTILPAAELEEISDLQTYGVGVTLGILLLASMIAWLIAGRVLAPVRLLTETARSLSQSDLTRRIEIRGTGDAAEMARSFNSMLDRLEGIFRSQRAFVQDAGHELRDPLTICRGHLELLGDDPEEQKRTIALVIDELDRMGRIVDDLQLLADATQPDFLRPEWVDMELFAHELIAKAGALASRDWQLDRADQGRFIGDRHRLTEAVMNLAHNAVQHTQAGDTVAIGASLTEEAARLWVRDSGHGVSISDQSRIFDRFARGRDAHRRYRGGGLGLAIVKAIAEAHEGHVELESRLGEGSTFTVVLPPHSPEGVVGGQDPDR
jgi:two-component system, OmpR family, sensor kinase